MAVAAEGFSSGRPPPPCCCPLRARRLPLPPSLMAALVSGSPGCRPRCGVPHGPGGTGMAVQCPPGAPGVSSAACSEAITGGGMNREASTPPSGHLVPWKAELGGKMPFLLTKQVLEGRSVAPFNKLSFNRAKFVFIFSPHFMFISCRSPPVLLGSAVACVCKQAFT